MNQDNLLMFLMEKRFRQSKDKQAFQNGFLDDKIVSDDEVDVADENDGESTTMSITRLRGKRQRQEEVDALLYDDDILDYTSCGSHQTSMSMQLDGLQVVLMTIAQAQTVHDIYDEIRPR